ncbi:hypothetical protein [Vibrio barjaei]|uniref:hypothetical protein n=1 Tax=Vibrio barjaei TaxID=1676683 RepID=UPI002283EFFD|nr:hypothetical protein [Vibrio barjaei]MCY9874026.1 hypothetical protein [Vibrio barjaei]
MKGSEARNRQAARLRAMRSELKALRAGVVRAHANCTANYVQTDTEMRRRAGRVLAAAINKSKLCLRQLGYYPGSMPVDNKVVHRVSTNWEGD